MKKTTFYLASAMLIAGTIVTACQSPEKKEENAQEKVQDAKQDLDQAQQDADAAVKKAAEAEEWKTFKMESNEKIRENEVRIAELKEKMSKPGKLLDPIYEKRIEALEQRINALKVKMEVYEKEHSDWETFKREFNNDMDELGQAFKDFTVDNKK